MPPRFGPRPGPRGPGPVVLVAAAAGTGAGLMIASRRRPARVHHRYTDRVVVIRSGSGRNARIVCPRGIGPGQIIEICVEDQVYFVTVPQGVGPGQIFEVQLSEAPLPPTFSPAAAIVSDNHGVWSRVRYEHLQGAEQAWSRQSFFHASCLFVQSRTGSFSVFKEYGTSKAVEQIKHRFYNEFKHELFPELTPIPTVHVVSTAANVPSQPEQQQAISMSQPSAPPAPPSYETSVNTQGGDGAAGEFPPAYDSRHT
mmetsp:Transcript_23766/g.30926  ORF Transcript_23766/g.30926 Transcript_23766/m.30926 type:complete len:255 (+) Transcript_23766:48-812(+)